MDAIASSPSETLAPLFLSAQLGDFEQAKASIAQGARIDQRDAQGFTPAMLAALAGHAGILELLLDSGADPHARSGIPGGDPARRSDGGWSVARCAAEHPDCLRMLIDRGADLDVRESMSGGTMLIAAATCNWARSARMLIEAGADVDAVDKSGSTAAIAAAGQGNAAIISLLFHAGADLARRESTTGMDASDHAELMGHDDCAGLCRAWIEAAQIASGTRNDAPAAVRHVRV